MSDLGWSRRGPVPPLHEQPTLTPKSLLATSLALALALALALDHIVALALGTHSYQT
jgi:hypothetical protein